MAHTKSGTLNVSTANLTSLNETLDCSHHFYLIGAAFEIAVLIVGLPMTLGATGIILHRHLHIGRGRLLSSTLSLGEIFLMNLNIISIVYTIGQLMEHLRGIAGFMHISEPFISALVSPSLTCGPAFLTALCLDCYLAVVYPVTYMEVKNWRGTALLLTAFFWLCAIAMVVPIFVNGIDTFHPIFMVACCVSLPVISFCNVSMLRVLCMGMQREGESAAHFDPVKKKAFWTILCVLVLVVAHYFPRIFLFIYRYITQESSSSFWCREYPLIMIPTMMCEIAIPLIFLHEISFACFTRCCAN